MTYTTMKKIIVSFVLISTLMLGGNGFAQQADQAANGTAVAVPAPTPGKHQMSVNKRLARQQRRINQGIKSGELTRGEAKNLERHEANIATDAKVDRAENGGKLTPQERKNLERRLNMQSKRIYNKKHS
jgi:hypothetical protein